MGKQDAKELQKKLRSYATQYKALKDQMYEIGFICPGSLLQRRVTCGNPKCSCSHDPEKRHGPYYQLSWKEKGRSVSRFLSPEEVVLFGEWVENRRKLTAVIDKMYDISQRVRDCMLPAKATKKRQPTRTKRTPKLKKPPQNAH